MWENERFAYKISLPIIAATIYTKTVPYFSAMDSSRVHPPSRRATSHFRLQSAARRITRVGGLSGRHVPQRILNVARRIYCLPQPQIGCCAEVSNPGMSSPNIHPALPDNSSFYVHYRLLPLLTPARPKTRTSTSAVTLSSWLPFSFFPVVATVQTSEGSLLIEVVGTIGH